jgi:hypothetical protein
MNGSMAGKLALDAAEKHGKALGAIDDKLRAVIAAAADGKVTEEAVLGVSLDLGKALKDFRMQIEVMKKMLA